MVGAGRRIGAGAGAAPLAAAVCQQAAALQVGKEIGQLGIHGTAWLAASAAMLSRRSQRHAGLLLRRRCDQVRASCRRAAQRLV